ncbi:FunK1 protein kinase [Hypoxylon crocopeplum]|nr:FunK1 protein kinase [Hypoxylon crocopeplum]
MENYSEVSTLSPPASTADDQEIFDNIGGRLHGPMSGFIKKYFGKFQHVHQDSILEIQAAGRVSGGRAVPPIAPSPNDFLQWFSNYVSREIDGARGSWHVSSGNAVLERGSPSDGARLLLTIPVSPDSDVQKRWDHVQVIGQFYHRSCPMRLFLHGFYIRGSLIELWVFDRSGLYCSDVFDLREEYIQFLSIILSYQRMTDQDLGRISIVGMDEGGSYVILDNAAMPSLGKLYLENEPIASREGLVGAGTTYYRARMPDSNQWNYNLKFKWRWARERPEDELLKLAKEKCSWDAVSLDYYTEVESAANLRRGLRWGTHRKFSKHFRGRLGHIEEQREDVPRNADGLVEYTEETDNYFQNRVLACVVTSPVGRPLHTFQSLSELLQILHRDISPGNMIILDGKGDRKPKGILIDLDSAIVHTEALGAEPGITGTRPFMAIGVLKRECHKHRHDLESFLYVFLWIVITNHEDNPPEASMLRRWSNGDWGELAVRKSLAMGQDKFRNVLDEFPLEFHPLKPLAEILRQILFPIRGGVIWTGTDGSPEAVDDLYDEMIRAFEDAIASETGR